MRVVLLILKICNSNQTTIIIVLYIGGIYIKSNKVPMKVMRQRAEFIP